MKHRKTPRWVDAAMAQRPTNTRNWLILSELVGRLEVECEQCHRRGRYRVDLLLAKHGDLPLIDIMLAIAAEGGCHGAIKPPNPYDPNYATRRCRIRRASISGPS